MMRISCSILAVLALALLQSAAQAQTSTYKNPVDGKEYTADWGTYEPEMPKNDINARVAIEDVRLLTSQDDLATRITVESLAAYIESLEADLLELAIGYNDSGTVLLQVDLAPEQSPVYQLAYDGSISTDLLQAFYEKISEPEDTPIVLGAVSFQLHMLVRSVSDGAVPSESRGHEPGWFDSGGQRSPDSESQKSKSGFGGLLLITTDQDWAEKWNTPPETEPELNTTSSVKIGERITTLIFLVNPLRDQDGQTLVRCDIRVTRPDGTLSADEKDMECFRRVVLDEHIRNVHLAGPYIGWMGEPGDPLGEWIMQVWLTDEIRGVTLDLKIGFTLEADRSDSP